MRRIQLLLPVFLFVCSFVAAQKVGLPEIEYFNRRQYKGGTQNWRISQDRHDLLYFANNEGVLVYDGVNWNLLANNAPQVVRSVNAIDQRVYSCSYDQFGYYEYDSLNHLSYRSLMDVAGVEPKGNYWNIHQWNDMVVIQSEADVTILKNDYFICSISSQSRFTSSFIVNNLLLVHDEARGLMEVRGNKIYPVAGGALFSDKRITSIIPVSDSHIIIGTMRNGLYLWDMNSIEEWNVPANALVKEANIFCGTAYFDRFLVYGSIQAGLIVVDKKGVVVMHIDKNKGLHNNTVLSVFVDKEGSIWAGLDNGIARVSFNAGVSYLQGVYDLGTGYCIEVKDDSYYFGTNQALYSIAKNDLYDPQKKVTSFNKITGTDGQVWCMFNASNELLCGHNLGAYSVSGSKLELITPHDVNGVWLFRTIVDHPNLLIAGTYNGLVIFEKRQGKWVFRSRVSGFDGSARFIEWDNKGNLLVSYGYSIVLKLTFNDDYSAVVHVEQVDFSVHNADPQNFTLCKLNNQCLFVGEEGLFEYSNNELKIYEGLDAYFDKGFFPNKMKQDALGNIWFFSKGQVGVLRIMEDGTYKKIEHPFKSIKNKLVNNFEFVLGVDEHNAFFGVEDGFAHYTTLDHKNYHEPFKVNIRSFKGKEDSVTYLFNQLDLGQLEQNNIPEYSFRNNLFEIEYAAAYYDDDGVEYATVLKGGEHISSPWSTSTSVQYSKLREGKYEFVIRARNKYGVQSKPLSFKFQVLPPWHRSIFAKVLYVFAFVLSTVLLLKIINKRIDISRKKEKIKQRELYHEKEQALRNEALRAEKEMIRMRNDKLRNDVVHKEKELANSTMSIIKKNEFLTNIKAQLKKIKQIEDKSELNSRVQGLIRKIDKDIDSESYWEIFETHLDQVHESFLNRLNEVHSDLSPRDRKLCAYIRMGMTSKEIASLMNISSRAVENNRYRLRQKLKLNQGDNLSLYISTL